MMYNWPIAEIQKALDGPIQKVTRMTCAKPINAGRIWCTASRLPRRLLCRC